MSDSATPRITARQASLSITNSQNLLVLMSIELVIIQPSHPLSFPFFSCLQSFPASGSFPMNQFFALGGQSIGVSGSTSVLPVNTQDWSPLGWTGWISLMSKGLSRVFSTPQFKSINTVQFSHPYMTTRKTITLTRQTFVGKVMSLLFNMLYSSGFT